MEPQAQTLLDNLALLTGKAASAAAERLNAIHEKLSQLRAVRDATAEAIEACALASPPISALAGTSALSSAIVDAIEAMRQADADLESSHSFTIRTMDGPAQIELPDSWKARRAALSVLGVEVTVNQEDSGKPRWIAEMHLPNGSSINGSWPECIPDRSNMFSTSRCREQVEVIVLRFTADDVMAMVADRGTRHFADYPRRS